LAKNIPLTLACGDYEIIRPLKEGTVKPDGIDLTVLTKMDSTTRHWRFLRNQDFDMAEVSCSSYILGHDRGFPFHAIPVFLHRRFRHGFIFINTKKGITKPKDLIGKKVGVKQFQATAVHWLRGLLEHEYGVPHTSIDWYSELDESVEFTPPPGLKITRLPSEKYVETMLAEAANRERGAVECERRYNRVDTRAVGQARIDHRRRFIDAPADSRDDPVDDQHQMLVILEGHVGRVQLAEFFDVNLVVAVDQDVSDGVVAKERLEWSEAEQLVF